MSLDDKIARSRRYGKRYTPTQEEWDYADSYQRNQMTWPAHVLDWIRSNP